MQNLQEVGVVNLASRWLGLVPTLSTLGIPELGGKGDESGIGNRESGIGGRGFRGLRPVGSVTVTDLR